MKGPIKRISEFQTQSTFCYVLGLFDEHGNEVVHEKADGTKIPVRFVSYPIDTDEPPQTIGVHTSRSGLIVQ